MVVTSGTRLGTADIKNTFKIFIVSFKNGKKNEMCCGIYRELFEH
jgi:hypothetical protein